MSWAGRAVVTFVLDGKLISAVDYDAFIFCKNISVNAFMVISYYMTMKLNTCTGQTDAPLSIILHPSDHFPACTCTAVTRTHNETQSPITSTTVIQDVLLYQTGGGILQAQ